jgi:membrane-associated phospholipid phosphatase
LFRTASAREFRSLILQVASGFAALAVFPWLGAELVRAIAGPWITASVDAPIVQYIAAHRLSWMTGVMKASTAAGNELSLWIAILVAGAILARLMRSWRPLLFLVFALPGAMALERIIKMMIARARPALFFRITPAGGWSFPSGHATESAAVYVTLAHMFADNKSSGIKTLAYAIAFTATCMIGVSRVYLGVHWPTDVICGWALGGAWSAVVRRRAA